MKMVQAKKWIYAAKFEGQPNLTNLKLVSEELPSSLNDGEILCEAVILTVDPYMRISIFQVSVGETMPGEQVAKVTSSKNDKFPVGTLIVGHLGWRTHTIVQDVSTIQTLIPDPDLPPSLELGVLGMVGMTASYGLFEILKPVAGETLLVNAAAGAVGSLVGQMAKLKGCKVIGFAGTKEKCDWLKTDLGFDAVFNYKECDVVESIRQVDTEGVDCFFDNVGGEFGCKVINNMKQFGRVAVCGHMDTYRYDDNQPDGPMMLAPILLKRLTVRGFDSTMYKEQWPTVKPQLIQWIKQGKLKYRETVTDGFEKMAEAFVGLFHGANIGKAIVKV